MGDYYLSGDGDDEGIQVDYNGNVGIGTTNTFGYKLAVNGSIGAKEVKVEISSEWPDYVFSDDYRLRKLKDVEQFIAKNGHLPDIPSEEEVYKKGIEVGKMNALLLQKIEELTLYLIDVDKELRSLKEENEIMRGELKRIERLK